MRLAIALAAAAVACSPPPKPTVTIVSPPDAQPTAVLADAGPVAAPVEAAPAPEACLAVVESVQLVGDEVRACSDAACLWIGVDGAVRAGPLPPPEDAAPSFPQATVGDDQLGVEVCTGAASCVTVAPALDGDEERIQDTTVDPSGRWVAILIHDGALGNGRVAVHDAKNGKRIAVATRRWDDHHGVHYTIEFLGSTLLWVEYPGATSGANGELWKVKGKKLRRIAELPGRTYAWGQVGRDTWAFGGSGAGVAIWDVGKGKRTGSFGVDGLVVGDAEADAWMDDQEVASLATRDGGFALVVVTSLAARVGFVDLATKETVIVEVPRCR